MLTAFFFLCFPRKTHTAVPRAHNQFKCARWYLRIGAIHYQHQYQAYIVYVKRNHPLLVYREVAVRVYNHKIPLTMKFYSFFLFPSMIWDTTFSGLRTRNCFSLYVWDGRSLGASNVVSRRKSEWAQRQSTKTIYIHGTYRLVLNRDFVALKIKGYVMISTVPYIHTLSEHIYCTREYVCLEEMDTMARKHFIHGRLLRIYIEIDVQFILSIYLYKCICMYIVKLQDRFKM